MLLIGLNRSPYTRRVAITLNLYGMQYEPKSLSGFSNRNEMREFNPLGRIPALVLDSGETLVDSVAIIDYLDEVIGPERALAPASGPDRRAVLKAAAVLMGACDKGLHAAYERNQKPEQKRHQPWIDDCIAQVANALAAVEAMLNPGAANLLLGRITHADVAAVIAERLARTRMGVETDMLMPKLRVLTAALAETPAFRATEP